MSATCAVSVGDNPLEFSWFFNGQSIISQDRPEISISLKPLMQVIAESTHAQYLIKPVLRVTAHLL
jgi:hypothetical protein